MNFIKKIPIPMAALILALATLGNLLQSYSNTIRYLFGIISSVLFVLFVIKLYKFPKESGKELENPVVASVFPTFSMAMMVLATYIKPIQTNLASIFWYLGVLLHIIFILDFSAKFLIKFNLKNIFASWFVVYVGIVVASVTAPVFERTNIGRIAFWFGFFSYLIILVTAIFRYIKYKDIPEPARPTFAIFAAPAGLLLAGYMNSFQTKSLSIVYFLLIASQLAYFIVLFKLPQLLKLKFYPSFAAFTFPIVITALGLKLTNKFLIENNKAISFLPTLVKIEELIATIIIIFVLYKYLNFLFKKEANN